MTVSEPLDLAALERLTALERAATPGPWGWNSYSGIAAKVPEGHPLEDYEEDDPGDRGLAWICWIDGGPKQKGHGDALIFGEARNNAALIEGLRNAAPALLRLARAGLAAETIVTPVGYQTMTPEERAAWVEWLEERGVIPTSDRLESKGGAA